MDLLRIDEYTLKNIVGNFWIMHFLRETLSNLYIYIYIYIYIYMFEIFEFENV